MNKKRLSVVMAGAMLATSVAPVLAAETTATTKEYSVGQEALLNKYIKAKFEEKEFTSNSVLVKNDASAQKYLGTDIATKLAKIKTDSTSNAYLNSVYEIKLVSGTNETVLTADNIDTKIKAGVLKAGDKIVISEKENTTFLGQVIPAKKAPEAVAENTKNVYTKAELTANGFNDSTLKGGNRFIKEITCTKDNEGSIVLKALTDVNNTNTNIKLDIKTGDVKYDLNLPVDAEGNLLDKGASNDDDLQKCAKFLKDSTWAGGYTTDADATKVETIDIVASAPVEEVVNYNVSDLYDGTLLTEKGTELLNDLKNDETNKKVVLSANTTLANGITSFDVQYKSKKGTLVKKVVVKSSETTNIKALFNMLKAESYKVGIVAGQNRYETAVNVAKESGVTQFTNGTEYDVVLTNGESLVDGLAAAPLAASKNNAPLLLTKTDSLPKETKEYLEYLTENVKASNLSKITINLVGGDAVLSDSLVKELKGMGFKVARYGGDDREETSIKVAKAISGFAAKGAYVVGANGEADAMSISAVAAEEETPIIVSSVHGLTADALDFLGNQDGNATIIGGEKAITKAEEDKIVEAKEDKTSGVRRIAGANRTETNAKILKEFAKTLDGKKLTLVKNGVNNKTDLIDALSAANLGGPIVLADSSLTDEQLTILLNLKSTVDATDTNLLQVGLGLNDSIIKSLSKALNITN
ncbi:cell wall-binding repeat-containing protein [Peptacetobacter hiranonis]|uniref:Putative cell wall binding repeat 2 n=1 Tax=Peptacetobacter hiranonis (strain DSM 13275 / JCM 10541 / KCTC 15199 / TO-931) TaxID=500633 RepID=B6FYI3_PEPHT|nr:cell wall-binding repeat-containing protein [Peptacetobacter hiranonis]EEA85414.1 putative cell wall binding repeat 2 [Peptacetobacter hiranonis DSM 13275]QEK20225.1 N-acetylmuramoyl-L-alanine amidase LytC [Peptacetobacter hiranonis]